MLTPTDLVKEFNSFCKGKACKDCRIFKIHEACHQRDHILVKCDVIWLVYLILAERSLLYKNPNSLEELIAEEDLQKLVVDITCVWHTEELFMPNSSFNEYKGSSKCESCPQRGKCNHQPVSCRLYFALINSRHLLDVIQHASTLRETC